MMLLVLSPEPARILTLKGDPLKLDGKARAHAVLDDLANLLGPAELQHLGQELARLGHGRVAQNSLQERDREGRHRELTDPEGHEDPAVERVTGHLTAHSHDD